MFTRPIWTSCLLPTKLVNLKPVNLSTIAFLRKPPFPKVIPNMTYTTSPGRRICFALARLSEERILLAAALKH